MAYIFLIQIFFFFNFFFLTAVAPAYLKQAGRIWKND